MAERRGSGLPIIVTHYGAGPREISLPAVVASAAVASDAGKLAELMQLAREQQLPQAAPEWAGPCGFEATAEAARRLEAFCAGG